MQPNCYLRKLLLKSGGGQLTHSHDGIAFYYINIPTAQDFTLTAEISVLQIGLATDATANRQEGMEIIVRCHCKTRLGSEVTRT